MDLLIDFLILVGGLVLLIKGSDWFVEGASDVAKALKIPSLIIGLTIVAFGTSAPEAAVSISASVSGNAGVAIGNVIGSNIFNLLMVIGVSSCICRLSVEKSIIIKDYPFNMLITVVATVLCCDMFLEASDVNYVSRTDGIILLCFFVIFLYYTISGALKARQDMQCEAPERRMIVSLLMLFAGIGCVIAGGEFTVNGACEIARKFNVSENMIALTIIAVGTSLPELVTSVTALRKGESDIAIGNVIGSNIFNLLFIIGISAVINPLSVSVDSIIDSLILIAVNLVVFSFIFKNKATGRVAGSTMIVMYIAFAIYVVLRGIN